MPRRGVEDKPPWQTVPVPVRRAVEAKLGAKVQRAMRVWGGYSPTPTYRLRLTDGRAAFFKAVSPASNDFAKAAHAREERVYRELGHVIRDWAPAFFGSCDCEGWRVMLLEDLGPKSAPPWTPALARKVARALGDFHSSTSGADLPSWLPRPDTQLARDSLQWRWPADADGPGVVANLAGEKADEALRWLTGAMPALARASRGIVEAGPPRVFIHNDVRSDNLRWVNGRLRLVDWPHVCVGPAEFDAAGFAQTVTVEGGPGPEQVMACYSERAPVRPGVLDAAVAAVAGFFADLAWRPDIPGLPRLRPFQKQQLKVTLRWAASRLGLPEPSWLDAIRP